MNPFDIGELRHRVTWLTRSVGPGTHGSEVETWTEAGTFRARVEPLRGWVGWTANQLEGGTSYEIAMRANAPIKRGDKLRLAPSGRVFSVVSVYRAEEGNAFLSISANELN